MHDQPFSATDEYKSNLDFAGFDHYFLTFIKRLEALGSSRPFFAEAYYRLFYKNMLHNEILFSGIKPDMNVVHIGCGPLPMTAMGIAAFGARVTAVDHDPDILVKAHLALKRTGTLGKATLMAGCGTSLDFSGYDAVWLSLHVRPMEMILKRVMDQVRPGSRIVFRDPRGFLCRYYPGADKISGDKRFKSIRVKQVLGKKSVILIKKVR